MKVEQNLLPKKKAKHPSRIPYFPSIFNLILTKMGKHYCVRVGRVPGIYGTWAECKKQVDRFPRAEFKSFKCGHEASAYMSDFNRFSYDSTSLSYASSSTTTSSASRASSSPPTFIEEAVLTLDSYITKDKTAEYNDEILSIHKRRKLIPPPSSQPSTQSQTVIIAYTDGSCIGNGTSNARAGVGVYFGPGDDRNISERLEGSNQTNNRAELTVRLSWMQKFTLFSFSLFLILFFDYKSNPGRNSRSGENTPLRQTHHQHRQCLCT